FLCAKQPKRPPDTRGRIETDAVIDDDGIAVADAERTGYLAELLWAGQHVRQVGRMIGDRFDVEEYRARDVALAILGVGVALLRRQEVRPVNDTKVAVTQMLGEPFRRNQPAAFGGGRECFVGSEHGGLFSQ